MSAVDVLCLRETVFWITGMMNPVSGYPFPFGNFVVPICKKRPSAWKTVAVILDAVSACRLQCGTVCTHVYRRYDAYHGCGPAGEKKNLLSVLDRICSFNRRLIGIDFGTGKLCESR